jgi:Ni,Fe-hydrogenase III large subunit
MTAPTTPTTSDRTRDTVEPDRLPDRAGELLARGMRLAMIAGHDDRPTGGGMRAVYLFTGTAGTCAGARAELHVPVDPDDPTVPSIAAMSFPAGRFERVMRDLFGIVPVGHPLPRRLVRHFHWPRGWYPMLSDAGAPPAFGDPDGPYPFRRVEGPGVYEIPVGPVHAGMIGPGHFRFSVVGETILKLKARLWFAHRGIEELAQGRDPAGALEIAQRISGDTTVGHALAFCLAVEDAQGTALDEHTGRLRALALELERLYNHVGDIGALCNDVGHGILNAHAQRIREQLLRVNDRVAGHRLLRGAVGIGTATLARLPDPGELAAVAADIAEVAELAVGHSVVRDRFAGTAVLSRQQATDLGVLGCVARASAVPVDARLDHPTPGTPATRTAHRHTGGDVLARFWVRVEEIAASVATITALVEAIGGQPLHVPASPRSRPGTAGSGVGIVEGWRGTIVHRVELAPDGTVARLAVVDPSFLNWPALPVALADTIVPDFPLVNKSFNLSYAGNDL